MSHWTDLRVFRLFYRQTASCVYLPDALLGGVGSFRLTFSHHSGPPDAQVCIFVVRERPEYGTFVLQGNIFSRKSV